jgi:putative MATE family efflux protein
MHDMTQGSISGPLARMAAFMLFGMVFQTLYFLVDLYFVSRVGSAAVAAVALCGNLMMVTIALTQALTVGTTTLVAHALGARDPAEARRVFNQSQALAIGVGLAFVALVFAARGTFADALSADRATAQAVREYLDWFLPAMGMQFLLVSIGAALRGAGEVRAPMLVGLASIVVNIGLCPVLIAGWGTGRPLGVTGAGLASFIAVCVGAVLLLTWVRRRHDVLQFEARHWKPDPALWRRMLAIGLPSGGEFLLMTVYSLVIFAVTRDLGADTQAGFGVGMRVLQTGFMPGLAIAFSISPIAAQNFGARRYDRVRESFRVGLVWVTAVMIAFMVLCHTIPERMVAPFSSEPAVVAVGAGMLGILCFNFVSSGIALVCGAMFQAIGNTVPSLVASASRLVVFAVPAYWMSRQPWFTLPKLWWLSVGSVVLQMCAALLLLRRELRRKMPAGVAANPLPATP